MKYFLSLQGRLPRHGWWIAVGYLLLLTLFTQLLLWRSFDVGLLLTVGGRFASTLVDVILLLFLLCIAVKRFQDRDKSGNYALIPVGLLILLRCLILTENPTINWQIGPEGADEDTILWSPGPFSLAFVVLGGAVLAWFVAELGFLRGTIGPNAHGEDPAEGPRLMVRFSEWLDSQSRKLFITPAVVLILLFSIFPLVASLIISLSRLKLTGLDRIRLVWFDNFGKQFFGSQQTYVLGKLTWPGVLGWAVIIICGILIIWWMVNYCRREFWLLGFIGRMITAVIGYGIIIMLSMTLLAGETIGTISQTLFYVFVGCGIQFFIGLGLAFLCSQQIRGRTFFRVVFFIPLMITPIGVGYSFRMMADTTKGPLAPVWQWVGLGDFAWASDAWTARMFIIIGDSWQWIPFIFVVMLAALENIPRDMVEAGEVDGASRWQIFREITWPQVLPVAATVLLIRMIEAFKIVDLPNIMTSGGPGTATESMTLSAFFAWRENDLGKSSSIAYLLLFITVVVCVSFFNLVVLRRVRKTA